MDHLTVPSREQIASLDDRAEWPVPVPQWTTADGQARGVWVKALMFRDRMLAERQATGKDGAVDAWRLVAEEVARGVTRPAGLTVDNILNWNSDAVEHVHNQILRLGGLAGAIIAQELARLAGGPPPPQPGAVAGHAGADPDDLGDDAG